MSDHIPEPGVPSPCCGICSLDATRRWCIGCRRTLAEIGEWGAASDARKRAILERIGQFKDGSIGVHPER